MKRLLLAATLAVFAPHPMTSWARQPPLTDQDRTFVEVFQAPGFTKQQVYAGAKIWIAENFRSAKAVTEYDNAEEGVIVGNGNIPYPCKGIKCLATSDWRINFTMKVEAKDERFRLTFTNLRLSWPSSYSSGFRTPAHDDVIYQRSDLDLVRPKLLAFGPEMAASLGIARASEDW